MERGEKWLAFWAFVLLFILIIGFSFLMLHDKIPDINSISAIFNSGKSDEAMYNKIDAAFELKEYNKALDMSSDFNALYPDSRQRVKVMIIEAKVFYALKDFDKTRIIIQKIFADPIIDNNDFIQSADILGVLARDDGKYDPIVMNYLENAYLKSDTAQKTEIAGFLGYQSLFKKDYNSAIKYFNNSAGEEGIIGRARVYIEQGNYPVAIQEYLNYFNSYTGGERYERIKTAFIKQSFYYAESLKKNGEYRKSIQYFFYVVNYFPADPSADEGLIKIADIYAINKDYKNAVDFLDKALNNNVTNGDEEALYDKAVIYYQWGKKNESIGLFKELKNKYSTGIFGKKSDDWIDLIKKDIEAN